MLKTRRSSKKPKEKQLVNEILTRRVVKDSDKLEKKRQILLVARQELTHNSYQAISMNEIALKANVAKGTLYLYFKTKEELALAVLGSEYETWFQSLTRFLESEPQLTPAGLAKWIANSLKPSPLFLQLMPLGPHLFESNVDSEFLVQYKKHLHNQLGSAAALLSKRVDGLSKQKASDLLIQTHVLVLGLINYGFPVDAVLKIIKQEKLQLLEVDYFSFLESSLARLFKSYW